MNRRLFLASLVAAYARSRKQSAEQRKLCPQQLESNVPDDKFKRGQVWRYTTRPGEDGSTLTILEVDRLSNVGTVVHVRVDGLKVHNPRGEVVPSIEHMPFTRDAMLVSVVQFVRTVDSLPTMEGYDRWLADCGGVYTISVADALNVAQKTFLAGTAD